MLRVAVTGLALLAISGAAKAQPAQADMLTQTVAAVTNPLSAWQASFSPNMVSRLRPLEAHSLSPNCRPVVVGLDKRPVSAAGSTLVAGTLCVATAREGLKSGLTAKGVSAGIDSAPLKGGISDTAPSP